MVLQGKRVIVWFCPGEMALRSFVVLRRIFLHFRFLLFLVLLFFLSLFIFLLLAADWGIMLFGKRLIDGGDRALATLPVDGGETKNPARIRICKILQVGSIFFHFDSRQACGVRCS